MGRVIVRGTAIVAAAWVVTLAAAGCGTSNLIAGRPTTAVPGSSPGSLPQSDLMPHYVAEADPMHVLKEGLYSVLRQPMGSTVIIQGYTSQIAADGTTSKVNTFAYVPPTGAWEQIPERELVWSPSKSAWIETDRTETLTPGPTGSRGWPTVKSVADFGTSYYTFSYQELDGQTLPDGLEVGFAEGGSVPASAQVAKFSPGARGYVQTQTAVDPFYTIHRVKNANTKVDQMLPVYACGTASPDCTTPATTLTMADQQGGQYTNFAGTVRLELNGNGHASLRPVETPDIPFANLTYRIVDSGGPQRITFQATSPGDADKFARAMGGSLEHFALFEYNGQVTIGFAAPAGTTTTIFAGYNRIAVNDIITHWTPALPEVQP
jgi:hypothetical protein